MSKVKIGSNSKDEELIGLDEVDEEWIGAENKDPFKRSSDFSRSMKISNINADYFVLSSDFAAVHPILEEDYDLTTLLKKDIMLTDEETERQIVLNVARPYPKKIEICDYHSSPNPVISTKVVTALCSLKTIYGIQLLPCTIVDHESNEYQNYYLMHIYNQIECIDYKRSEFKVNEKTGSKTIQKIRLNNVSLNKISITNRLVFRPEGAKHLKIFHKSVVEAIQRAEVVGLKFYTMKDYYDGVQFDSFLKNY